MTVHAIKQTAARSLERQALAAAIEMAAQAERAEAAAREAVARAIALVAEAEKRGVAADVALVSAKESHSAAVAAAIGKGATPPVGTLKMARAEVEAATDGLETSKEVLRQLETALTDREAETADADLRREAAINRVLAVAAVYCLKRLVSCRAELVELLSVAVFVQDRGREQQGFSSGYKEVPALAAPLKDVANAIADALEIGVPRFNSVQESLGHPAIAAWRAACVALAADADASLPTD